MGSKGEEKLRAFSKKLDQDVLRAMHYKTSGGRSDGKDVGNVKHK